MGPIFGLSMRQLSGKWRLAIILLVAATPVGVVLAIRASGGLDDGSASDLEDAVRVLLDGMIVAAVLPIVTMTFATASFGNEVEDGTLGYLILNPVSRWWIALGKVLAPVTIAGPVLAASGIAVALIGAGRRYPHSGGRRSGPLRRGSRILRDIRVDGPRDGPSAGIRPSLRIPLGGPAELAVGRDSVPERTGIHPDADGGHRRLAAGRIRGPYDTVAGGNRGASSSCRRSSSG